MLQMECAPSLHDQLWKSHCMKDCIDTNFKHHFGSEVVVLTDAGNVGSGGRRRIYKAGPTKGTNDKGSSHDPLSNLQKESSK